MKMHHGEMIYFGELIIYKNWMLFFECLLDGVGYHKLPTVPARKPHVQPTLYLLTCCLYHRASTVGI